MYVYVHAAYKKLDFIAAVISFIFCGREILGKTGFAVRHNSGNGRRGALCVLFSFFTATWFTISLSIVIAYIKGY